MARSCTGRAGQPDDGDYDQSDGKDAAAPASRLRCSRHYGGGLDVNTGGRQFDVSSDGRFPINTVLDSAATPITLLQNWKPK